MKMKWRYFGTHGCLWFPKDHTKHSTFSHERIQGFLIWRLYWTLLKAVYRAGDSLTSAVSIHTAETIVVRIPVLLKSVESKLSILFRWIFSSGNSLFCRHVSISHTARGPGLRCQTCCPNQSKWCSDLKQVYVCISTVYPIECMYCTAYLPPFTVNSTQM